MPSSRAIKNRIKSTKNIQQITKAMEAVSAVKMRKSEGAAIKGRPFALHAVNILKKIDKSLGEDARELSPLFKKREIKKALLVVVASDKGLAGAFNSNVIKAANNFVKHSAHPLDIVAVGKKSKEYFERNKFSINRSFELMGDYATLAEIKPLSEHLISLFESGTYDKVDIIYTNFISALKQEVVHRPLLPLNAETLRQVVENIIPSSGKFSEMKVDMLAEDKDYTFEPSLSDIVKNLVPTLVEIEVFHSILEANASEHAARMVAMKNASENAKELIKTFTISYNKARQAQITKELIEIVSGKEALAAQES